MMLIHLVQFDDVDTSRSVWLNVFGISPVAWNVEFFSTLASFLGTLISIDASTVDGQSMEVARIQISLDIRDKVQESAKVLVDGKHFTLVIKVDASTKCRLHLGNSRSLF